MRGVAPIRAVDGGASPGGVAGRCPGGEPSRDVLDGVVGRVGAGMPIDVGRRSEGSDVGAGVLGRRTLSPAGGVP